LSGDDLLTRLALPRPPWYHVRYSVDSLRQLATKFLEKEELLNYQFSSALIDSYKKWVRVEWVEFFALSTSEVGALWL